MSLELVVIFTSSPSDWVRLNAAGIHDVDLRDASNAAPFARVAVRYWNGTGDRAANTAIIQEAFGSSPDEIGAVFVGFHTRVNPRDYIDASGLAERLGCDATRISVASISTTQPKYDAFVERLLSRRFIGSDLRQAFADLKLCWHTRAEAGEVYSAGFFSHERRTCRYIRHTLNNRLLVVEMDLHGWAATEWAEPYRAALASRYATLNVIELAEAILANLSADDGLAGLALSMRGPATSAHYSLLTAMQTLYHKLKELAHRAEQDFLGCVKQHVEAVLRGGPVPSTISIQKFDAWAADLRRLGDTLTVTIELLELRALCREWTSEKDARMNDDRMYEDLDRPRMRFANLGRGATWVRHPRFARVSEVVAGLEALAGEGPPPIAVDIVQVDECRALAHQVREVLGTKPINLRRLRDDGGRWLAAADAFMSKLDTETAAIATSISEDIRRERSYMS